MWISIWFDLRRLFFGCKIFPIRGFWILLIYFGYDLLMNLVSAHFGVSSGVAHWAHVGDSNRHDFSLAILLSRQFNRRGGDLLSVALGKQAGRLYRQTQPADRSRRRRPGLGIPCAAVILRPAA